MPHTINVNTGTKREDQTRLKPCHIQYHFSKHNIFFLTLMGGLQFKKMEILGVTLYLDCLKFILFHLLRFDFLQRCFLYILEMICLNQFRTKRSWNLTSIATTIEGFFSVVSWQTRSWAPSAVFGFNILDFCCLSRWEFFVLMFDFVLVCNFFGYSIVMCRGGGVDDEPPRRLSLTVYQGPTWTHFVPMLNV